MRPRRPSGRVSGLLLPPASPGSVTPNFKAIWVAFERLGPRLGSFLEGVPYCLGDPKREPHLENYPSGPS